MGDSTPGYNSLVARRIQEWNAKLGYAAKWRPLRHRTFAARAGPLITEDYRETLRHVDPHHHSLQKDSVSWPKLRHYHRKSEVRTRPSSFSHSSHRSSSSVAFWENSRRHNHLSPEIEVRKELRPTVKHACGHLEKVATVGISNGSEHEKMYTRSPEGSLIIVGPHLRSAATKSCEVAPFSCSKCQQRLMIHDGPSLATAEPQDANVVRNDEHAVQNDLSASITPLSHLGIIKSTSSAPRIKTNCNNTYHSTRPSRSTIEYGERADAKMSSLGHEYSLFIPRLNNTLIILAKDLQSIISKLQNCISSVKLAQSLISALSESTLSSYSRSTLSHNGISQINSPSRSMNFEEEANPRVNSSHNTNERNGHDTKITTGNTPDQQSIYDQSPIHSYLNDQTNNFMESKSSHFHQRSTPPISLPGAFPDLNSNSPIFESATDSSLSSISPRKSPFIPSKPTSLLNLDLLSPTPKPPSMPQLISLLQQTAQQDLGIKLPPILSPALNIKVHEMIAARTPSILQSVDDSEQYEDWRKEERSSEGSEEDTEYITAHHRWRWRWLVLTDEEE